MLERQRVSVRQVRRDGESEEIVSNESQRTENSQEQIQRIKVDRIEPNPFQPRGYFDEKQITELAESLRLHGQLQPCIVRPHPGQTGSFQLVAGERRWRASKSMGFAEIDCVVRNASNHQALLWSYEENEKRENFNPLDRARYFFSCTK